MTPLITRPCYKSMIIILKLNFFSPLNVKSVKTCFFSSYIVRIFIFASAENRSSNVYIFKRPIKLIRARLDKTARKINNDLYGAWNTTDARRAFIPFHYAK